MLMLEDKTRYFVMQGARDAMSRGCVRIQQQVTAVERAVHENPGLAFDLSRSLIESVCYSILLERSIGFSRNDSLPQLYRKVTESIAFLPTEESHAADVRQSLQKTLNGLNTSIHGICELRNRCGFASHGSHDRRPLLESVDAWMAAEAADTIVGFLYRVHKRNQTSQDVAYDDNVDFNRSIDENHGMFRVLDAEFRPSEVLFQMEPETYRIHLAEFDSAPESADGSRVGREV